MTKEIYLLSVLLCILLFVLQYKIKHIQPKVWNIMPESTAEQQVYIMGIVSFLPYLNILFIIIVVFSSILVYLNDEIVKLTDKINKSTEKRISKISNKN